MGNIKSIIKNNVTVVILFCAVNTLYAQPDWKQRRNEDGIKVFTASTELSDFKSIKVECTVNARLSQLIAFLLDVNEQHNWVYGNKFSQLIKQTGPNDLIFYSEVSVPWPCTNRDYIAHITVNQISPQLVTIDSHAEPGLLPHKEGKVRVKSSVAHWDVTVLNKNQLQIVYTVQFDPSGAVPAWLVNMFLTKGPFQTFQKLREEVNKPAYQNAHVAFIKE